jgi:hypothetical protein
MGRGIGSIIHFSFTRQVLFAAIIAHGSLAASAVAQVPTPVGSIPLLAGSANSYGTSSYRYDRNGTLYAWDGQSVYTLNSGTYTAIGSVPAGNSADPGPINFSADGQQILVGNGGGGFTGGSYNGEIFALPVAGGTAAAPVGNVATNYDFVPVPSGSSIAGTSSTKYFVDGSTPPTSGPASGTSFVSVFDSSNGTSVTAINIPGASASMAVDPQNQRLYVEDGYDSSNGSDFTGEIRSFALSDIASAISTGTVLSFSAGQPFNTDPGIQSGAGLFFDKHGLLLSAGSNADFSDGGVVAFNIDGTIAKQTSFGGFTSIFYNPALNQVVDENGNVYDAVAFEPEPANLALFACGGLALLRRRSRRRAAATGVALAALGASPAFAGPYAPAGGMAGSTAIPATSSSVVEWASGATITRGVRNIENPTEYNSNPSDPSNFALYGGVDGISEGTGSPNTAPIGAPPQPQTSYYGVALGQNGNVAVTFNTPIANGPGADFAVFGNGFSTGSNEWAKLAYVEVSSDGVNFFRFPDISLTQTTTQVGNSGELDPTNLYDFAGKDPAGYGTPFDLQELSDTPGLNVNDVIAVRVVAVTGDINPAFASLDSKGNIINDAWPAPSSVHSEGFDLAGVGVINEAPEPSAAAAAFASLVLCTRRRPTRAGKLRKC